MLNNIKFIIQVIAISCFGLLSIIGIIQRDWNFGVGINLSLVGLYIFLFLQPIK
jgi:hypothetical protein